MSDLDRPIALEAYEKLAKAYAAIAETKAENGYNEHPAIRAAIGDVKGLSVFDAGCGPGFLSRDLLSGGAAKVVGVDVSPTMIALAKERCGERAELYVGDLGQPLAQPDAAFDLIVSSLAIDYVRDWAPLMSEFRRILRPGGRLVFTVQHPMGSYKWFEPESPFGVHYCEAAWRGFTDEPVVVPDYYRSFEEVINPVLSAGFMLDRLTDTKPVPALKEVDPAKYERGMRFPTFMVVEARLGPACTERHTR